MTDASRERVIEPEIATTTLAEIYVQQGLVDRALAIYRRVAERTPDDARVVARVAELERELERLRAAEPDPTAAAVARPAEPAPAPAAAEPPAAAAPPVAPRAPALPSPDRDERFQTWLQGK